MLLKDAQFWKSFVPPQSSVIRMSGVQCHVPEEQALVSSRAMGFALQEGLVKHVDIKASLK